MQLTTVWFVLIAMLWAGYFVLEGFDFGVGVVLPFLARDEAERRAVAESIRPVWDGNEVWFLGAGAATFAAFPAWYATLFSGFRLPLLLILAAVIIRMAALAYHRGSDGARGWDRAFFWASLIPSFLWGAAFANIVHGVPLDVGHAYRGSPLTLVNPYALLGGAATLVLFALYGAVFLALRTEGELRAAAARAARRLGLVALVVVGAFLVTTELDSGKPVTWLTAAMAVMAVAAALVATVRRRDGWAFAANAAAIVAVTATLFMNLWPNVMPALDPANTLTVYDASSTPYTLSVLTWVAGILTPVVLTYQAWTCWVFRKRLTAGRGA
ncbi:cytochrome d ubiquinol oxidase subunit II [Sphaerisporangium sp. TRM90804]|uniref:cytochrome d ubiquinol oxidase subunit II n=1 Tax=Sphaerisporangium sp. TRM90804 TaxID=3031113 RepID=UPI00244691C3|nr:cytochrome d ubiquinol oxidase subunit II [Sphaerisporangium sp. TRM90804]MDH2425377.1 cytochrome d ubiquinol oxidase subunit II [Sphaerisporangium sp. TRM90804]